jgi:hypothetical protein
MNINLIIGIIKNFVQRLMCSMFGAKDIYQCWNKEDSYEPKTIVIYENEDKKISQAYISIQTVPSGIEITNTKYWQSIPEYFNNGGNKKYSGETTGTVTNYEIQHNLNGYPLCTFIDISIDPTTDQPINEEIIGDIKYNDEMSLTVSFTKAVKIRYELMI